MAWVESHAAAAAATRRSYVIWAGGVLAYISTVMQRTTLGVSGLDAADRFAVTPAALSAFVFVQVVVYVAMQLPAGVLVQRWGSRLVVVASGVLIAAAQLMLAVTTDLTLAVLARVVVGAGDAMLFVAVLALLPSWFPGPRIPVITQLTAILGQAGQILSAVPFVAVLHAAGWTAAFGSAAAVSILCASLALVVLRDAPGVSPASGPATSARETLGELAAVWRRPGTRLGFFGHMATQFPMMVFSLLWGMPYLISAQGLSTGAASGLLTLFVVCTIAIGPLMGVLATRYPKRRSWLLLAVCGGTVAVWTAVLALPGPAPRWLLVVLMVVLAGGGPGSIVGFDVARTFNPRPSLAVAQSMVNLGGFAATLTVLVSMGWVLDTLGGFTFDAFRAAWLVQYPFWAFAVIGLLLTRRKVRRDDTSRMPPRTLTHATKVISEPT